MSGPVTLSRRDFLRATSASALAWPLRADAQAAPVFAHGVASGDPTQDAVIIWTRVTPAAARAGLPVSVRWQVTTDTSARVLVKSGTVTTSAMQDFTVKVDVTGLEPGRTYLYSFEAEGERSPLGRTRTLRTMAARAQLAVVSCANYPGGYFNAYAAIAARDDLDAVLHLGDYIYEFADGVYGDPALDRHAEPRHEAVSLQDYRQRYACSRRDPDLQELHRVHPMIAIWDDHEFADNAWSGGAANHDPLRGEGNWGLRRANAVRAYREWLPVRERPNSTFQLYRSFRFGQLATLAMLDTRLQRSAPVAGTDIAGLTAQNRRMIGIAQEQWLYTVLREGAQAGAVWSLIGQGIMFSPMSPPGRFAQLPDAWDGYQAERGRIRDVLATLRTPVVLTGDMHSSWGFDIPKNPWAGYRPETGEGSVAVELITPAVSSAPFFTDAQARTLVPGLLATLPHLKYLEGRNRGYLLLDLTPERLLASWYFTPDVTRRSPAEVLGASFAVAAGAPRLVRA